MDDISEISIKRLKFVAKVIIPFYIIHYSLYFMYIFKNNIIFFNICLFSGCIAMVSSCNLLDIIISTEIFYRLKLYLAIPIKMIIFIFLPFIIYYTIDPFFLLMPYNIMIFIVSYFFIMTTSLIGAVEGYNSAILDGKYDDKILEKLRKGE